VPWPVPVEWRHGNAAFVEVEYVATFIGMSASNDVCVDQELIPDATVLPHSHMLEGFSAFYRESFIKFDFDCFTSIDKNIFTSGGKS